MSILFLKLLLTYGESLAGEPAFGLLDFSVPSILCTPPSELVLRELSGPFLFPLLLSATGTVMNGAFGSLPSVYKKYTFPDVLGICVAPFLFSNAGAGFS